MGVLAIACLVLTVLCIRAANYAGARGEAAGPALACALLFGAGAIFFTVAALNG